MRWLATRHVMFALLRSQLFYVQTNAVHIALFSAEISCHLQLRKYANDATVIIILLSLSIQSNTLHMLVGADQGRVKCPL